jgi:SAM-dependent methyltransferase
MEFEQADLNTIDLPRLEFDIVWSHAALHHVVELERLGEQVDRSLRPDGVVLVVDVISANGYRMWPENRQVARSLFAALPPRFRLNHTAYNEPKLDAELWEADTSEHSMECIRSQDIVPVFERQFRTDAFVPYFSIVRRFLDTMYGPNYDLSATLDTALLNAIWELDIHHLRTGVLKPETYFAIYRRRGSS